jgi:hypothetical protein
MGAIDAIDQFGHIHAWQGAGNASASRLGRGAERGCLASISMVDQAGEA